MNRARWKESHADSAFLDDPLVKMTEQLLRKVSVLEECQMETPACWASG